MKTRLRNLWEVLRSTFWIVPALMTMAAVALSFGLIALDETVRDRVLEDVGWLWAGGPEGARALLSTVAGSMITVAGVVFSITIVALSLASSQFGPRLLRNFVRDTGNQIVLGTFIATFVYCLLVLRTVRGDDGQQFVPAIAITAALVLAMASLGVLIYFIHHVAASIQVSPLITVVSEELLYAIDRLFPQELGHGDPEPARQPLAAQLPERFEPQARRVNAARSGYLQAVDGEGLMDLATEYDLIVHVNHRPGHFVVQGGALAMVWPGDRLDERRAGKIREAFLIGAERTLTQDVEFALDQLVEVAVRALSPGTNDPFTAMACIDRLGEALCRLAERALPSSGRYDDSGQLRVVAYPFSFADATEAAFDQIRQYGRSSTAVTIRLLEVIAAVAAYTSREEDRAALLQQANMVKRGSQKAIPEERDRQEVEARYQAVERALEQRWAPSQPCRSSTRR
jgi:uncharacterized membrane protein